MTPIGKPPIGPSLNGNPIVIDGLWGLSYNNLPGGTVLFFASGPNDETHGLVGTLSRP